MKVSCVCSGCGKGFQRHASNIRTDGPLYCGMPCYHGARIAKTETVVCAQCGCGIKRTKGQRSYGHAFCSQNCVHAFQEKRVEIVCLCCGDTFKRKGGGKFCSPACFHSKRPQQKKWLDQSDGRLGTLYLLRLFDQHEVFYKIGITYTPIQKRYGNKVGLLGYEYEIIAQHVSAPERVYEWEQSILETFSYLSYKPARKMPGHTECFSSAEEILTVFPL